MKVIPLVFALFSLPAGAIEFPDGSLEQEQLADAPESTGLGAPTELDPITVYGGKSLWGTSLKGLPEKIPCLGCEGKPLGRPFILDLGIDLGLFLAQPFFQQPRVRGEPNDEAAYFGVQLAQCFDRSPGCEDRHPNPGLYNWRPSDRAEDDWILNSANMVLQNK